MYAAGDQVPNRRSSTKSGAEVKSSAVMTCSSSSIATTAKHTALRRVSRLPVRQPMSQSRKASMALSRKTPVSRMECSAGKSPPSGSITAASVSNNRTTAEKISPRDRRLRRTSIFPEDTPAVLIHGMQRLDRSVDLARDHVVGAPDAEITLVEYG